MKNLYQPRRFDENRISRSGMALAVVKNNVSEHNYAQKCLKFDSKIENSRLKHNIKTSNHSKKTNLKSKHKATRKTKISGDDRKQVQTDNPPGGHDYCVKSSQKMSATSTNCSKDFGDGENNLNNKFPSAHFTSEAYDKLKKFHEKLKTFCIRQCVVCKEAWPNISGDMCTRCKRDKILPRKFSNENNMIPSPVPPQLQGLTQVEEMLIARAFPVMNVYCKPRGGQRAYRGHVITFPCKIKKRNKNCYLIQIKETRSAKFLLHTLRTLIFAIIKFRELRDFGENREIKCPRKL